jgi:hypothetical protein
VSPPVTDGIPSLRIPAGINKVGCSENKLKGISEKRDQGLDLRVIDVVGTPVNKEVATLDGDPGHNL